MQLRDYVHVRDIARANLLAMDTGNRAIGGRILNIGWGVGHSVVELDAIIRGLVGTDLLPTRGPALPEEILKIALDPSVAADLLGWVPEIGFAEGLADLVEFHRKRTGEHA